MTHRRRWGGYGVRTFRRRTSSSRARGRGSSNNPAGGAGTGPGPPGEAESSYAAAELGSPGSPAVRRGRFSRFRRRGLSFGVRACGSRRSAAAAPEEEGGSDGFGCG